MNVCPQFLLVEMDMSDQLNAPAALPLGERASGRHSIGGCVAHSRSGHCDGEKNLSLSGIEPRSSNRPRNLIIIKAEVVKWLKVKKNCGVDSFPSECLKHLPRLPYILHFYVQPPVRRKA